ncbi:MAG: hypothetical protein JWL59_3804 [Chthoniobacteraceae bacterium]|nr:hypothetical protein [Chthoniobacteraceae bacterium]
MPTSETHSENLSMYVNDMAALERHLHEAIVTQNADERVKADPGVAALLARIHTASHRRMTVMETHAATLQGGGAGAALKEAVTSVAGTLAGLYGKVRKHPISRMLRDDYVALSLTATAYSMLYTTALAVRDVKIAVAALENLENVTPLIMELTRMIPRVVLKELAEDDPNVDHSAAETAVSATIAAWTVR